jgi:hypothetical protein
VWKAVGLDGSIKRLGSCVLEEILFTTKGSSPVSGLLNLVSARATCASPTHFFYPSFSFGFVKMGLNCQHDYSQHKTKYMNNLFVASA